MNTSSANAEEAQAFQETSTKGASLEWRIERKEIKRKR